MPRNRSYSRVYDDEIQAAGYDHNTGERVYHERLHVAEDPRHIHMFSGEQRAGTFPGAYRPISVPSDPQGRGRRGRGGQVQFNSAVEYAPAPAYESWLKKLRRRAAQKAAQVYADYIRAATERRRDSLGALSEREQRHVDRQNARLTRAMVESGSGNSCADSDANFVGGPPKYGNAPPRYEDAVRQSYRAGRGRILPLRSAGPRMSPIPVTRRRSTPRSTVGRPYRYGSYLGGLGHNVWHGPRDC